MKYGSSVGPLRVSGLAVTSGVQGELYVQGVDLVVHKESRNGLFLPTVRFVDRVICLGIPEKLKLEP